MAKSLGPVNVTSLEKGSLRVQLRILSPTWITWVGLKSNKYPCKRQRRRRYREEEEET